jgi:hypothetical protein
MVVNDVLRNGLSHKKFDCSKKYRSHYFRISYVKHLSIFRIFDEIKQKDLTFSQYEMLTALQQ